jgi:hypothetical protein
MVDDVSKLALTSAFPGAAYLSAFQLKTGTVPHEPKAGIAP